MKTLVAVLVLFVLLGAAIVAPLFTLPLFAWLPEGWDQLIGGLSVGLLIASATAFVCWVSGPILDWADR